MYDVIHQQTGRVAANGSARNTKASWRFRRWVLSLMLLAASLNLMPGTTLTALAAGTPNAGVMVEGSLTGTTGPALTLPRGAVWVADTAPGNAAGGHWWVSDQVSGICRVDPITPVPANPPQFTLTNCNGTVKSGGEIVIGDVPGSTNKYIYVADAASKSTSVVRFTFNPASATLVGSLVMSVPNNTQKGGGLAGGRPVALALIKSPGAIPAGAGTCSLATGTPIGFPAALAAGEQDLLVSYLKSGDVIRVFDVNHTTLVKPCQTQIGSTSDGIGVNAFGLVGNDLYLAEVGGFGMSKITDPTGITRSACTNLSQCSAVTVPGGVGFPGGMASDGTTYLYVGDVRAGGATNYVYRFNVATGVLDLYSNAITPSYQAKNSSQVVQTFSSYVFPIGMGYRADTGELYVMDDPQLTAAVPTLQQGHLWRVAPSVVVNSVTPNIGPAIGGTSVTINGLGLSSTAGATTIKFGGVAAAVVSCASSTTCTATTPSGSGTVDVNVSVSFSNQPFAASTGTLAAGFSYITAPSVTGVAPNSGPTSGGTSVIITGTGFSTTPGGTTVTFGANAALSVTCATSTSCMATSPANAVAGAVDVVLTSGGQSSAVNPLDVFTYVNPNAVAVSSISPAFGSASGGDIVTINGTGFDTTGLTSVSFGPNAAASVTCLTTTQCTATSPAGAGTVDVIVTVVGVSNHAVAGDLFSYTPAVTSISPTSGSANGGTVVTINGNGFLTSAGTTMVQFGANLATGVSCSSATLCTATSPAGAGTVDVIVSVGGQSSVAVAADQFSYIPTVTSVSPASGIAAGGTSVTINGTGFVAGSTTVSFGLNAATGVSCTATSCTATSPAGAGTVDVIVTVGGQSSAIVAADQFAYIPAPTVTSINPTSGVDSGGDIITINGTGFSTAAGATSVFFGANAATNVTCASTIACNAASPAGIAGTTVNVIVTVAGQSGTLTAAFTYNAAPANPFINSITPNRGLAAGGTLVTINGGNFTNANTPTPTVLFGANAATNVTCASATSCTVTSPSSALDAKGAPTVGTVDVTVVVSNTAAGGLPNVTSPVVPADQFTYVAPVANLYAWGITAPKGGAVWIPGALGGHWWSSDHAQGLCRQDAVPTSGQFGIPGNTLHAINFAVCGDDIIGSAGQAVYDPRPVVVNGTTFSNLHYVYVPDNAVKSTAVWRLTIDANTETMVADPLDGVTMATAMIPLADVRTLKPNGMALGPLNPDGTLNTASPNFGLYVTDLVDRYVRKISNPDGDPRTQTVTIVAQTGDNRGANGTQGFIGNLLYISGNRASQFIDVSTLVTTPVVVAADGTVTQCPILPNPVPPATPIVCGMASVPAPLLVFVSGTAVDVPHKLVYLADSPGAAGALIDRYDASHDVYVPFLAGFYPADLNGVVHCTACTFGPTAAPYIQTANLPAPNSPNGTVVCALTCLRPWDQSFHPTTNLAAPVPTQFAFAFGLAVGPNSELIITEDPSAGNRSGRGTMWSASYIP